MQEYCIGDYFGNETLTVEYKEYCLRSMKKKFEKKAFREWIEKKNFFDYISDDHFRTLIQNDIHDYIQKYLPKYIGNFNGAETNGTLFIGINNDGFLEGIPWIRSTNGFLDMNRKWFSSPLENMIEQSLNNVRIFNTNEHSLKNKIMRYLLKKRIQYTVYILNYTEEQKIHDKELFERKKEYLETRLSELKQEWERYNNEYELWKEELSKYSRKLTHLLKDPIIKQELRDYILDSTLSETKDEVLTFLKSHQEFKRDISYEYIDSISKDFTNPFAWLIQFKDEKIHTLKQRKPIAPLQKPSDFSFHFLTNNLSTFRHILNQNENYVDYYILKINIPNMSEYQLEYKQYSRWVFKKRIHCPCIGPLCI